MLMRFAREYSAKKRAERFAQLAAYVQNVPRPLRIIDIGGTNEFWEAGGWTGKDEIQITLINHAPQEQVHSNIVPLVGDATDLSAHDSQSFDLAFSNSVIEHLFTIESQSLMAKEVQRVGTRFWVQTPNYWFPMEPHFHFVGWQWLPESVRVEILRRRRCGWRGKTPDRDQARELVREVRLMTKSELRSMFPNADIRAERSCGLVKSWIVVDGSQTSASE